MIETLVLIVGWIVVACGSVALVALIGAFTMDYVWTRIKNAYGLEWVMKAMDHYRRTHPAPFTEKDEA